MKNPVRFFSAIASVALSMAANAQLLDKKALTLEAAQKIAAASLVEAHGRARARRDRRRRRRGHVAGDAALVCALHQRPVCIRLSFIVVV